MLAQVWFSHSLFLGEWLKFQERQDCKKYFCLASENRTTLREKNPFRLDPFSKKGFVCTTANWRFSVKTMIIIEPVHDKTYKMACASSEDSDQPGHSPILIRFFAVRMKKAWVLCYSLNAQRRL